MPNAVDLIERSGDLAPIEEALAAAGAGAGAVAFIAGPAGIGKTALLGAASGLGRTRGFELLSATGTALERGFPFGIARQLYGQVRSRLGEPQTRGAVDALFAPAGDARTGPDLSFQILDGLYWLAADLAQEAPLLIAVDDVQWCDEPSLRHLLYLARRLDDLGVLVLATERTGEPPRAALDDLRGLAGSRVEPSPLSLAGVGELVERILGEAPTPAFASACLEQTGGYPLYLGELLRAAGEHGIDPDDGAAGEIEDIDAEGLESHVWRRIEAVGEEAGTVAGLVFVLGERADVGRIGLLTDLSPATVAEIVGRLAAKGVLAGAEPARFSHPVVRASVQARLSPGHLDRWHRDAARLLDREGADIREVAGHLIECHPRADPWAVERLRQFAAAVLGPGAPEAAARALRRALAEPPEAGERLAVLRELARAEGAADEPAAALDRLKEASRLVTGGRSRAELAIDEAQLLTQAGDFPAAVETLERGLADLGGEDPDLEQRVDAELITYALFSPEVRESGLRRLARYEGRVPDGPAAQAALTAMAFAALLTRQPAAEALALAERALQAGGVRYAGLGVETWAAAAWVTVFADRPDVARLHCEPELQAARRRGTPREIFAIESVLAFAALRSGDIPTAVSRAQTGIAISGGDGHEAWVHATVGLALIDAGKLDEAERALAATAPAQWEEQTDGSTALFYARAQLRIAQGRLDEASRDLGEQQRRSEAVPAGMRTADDFWRVPGITLAQRRGDPDRACALAAEELEFARHFGAGGYLGTVLRVAATVSEPETGLEMLRESIELLSSSQLRLEYARSLVELGAMLRRRGERLAAREPLAEGLDVAHRCGAGAVVTRALGELRAAGARPRRPAREGVEALTPTETRVALLAARGGTNREIAQELYVTLKTVEGTLGRAYSKLGISGRGARQALPEALESLLGDS